MEQPRIAFIGGGNMASSIIGGLVAGGYAASDITASDPLPETLERLRDVTAVNTTSDNHEAVAASDVLVMAVKPQVMKTVAQELAPSVQKHRPVVISIAAGISADSLEQWLGGDLPLVRCMPNTPALVRCGATALYANSRVSNEQRAQAGDILQAIGTVLWVDREAQLDAVTAISGSGPAYFFLVMEALQQAGESLGLDTDTACELVLQTALGAAIMARRGDVDPAGLRRRVSSPGGTTERAIGILEDGGLRELMRRAVTGARDRSVELSRELADESDH